MDTGKQTAAEKSGNIVLNVVLRASPIIAGFIGAFLVGGVVIGLLLSSNISKKQQKVAQKQLELLLHRLNGTTTNSSQLFMPQKLELIKHLNAPHTGINVTTVHIPGVPYPYNASLVKGRHDNYLLFFRHDVYGAVDLEHPDVSFETYISVVELDPCFTPISEYITIDTGSKYSEDPRAFYVQDRLFLIYNDLIPSMKYGRRMMLCEIDPNTFSVKKIKSLDLNMRDIEKNWMPFVPPVQEKDSAQEEGPAINFVYSINPLCILSLKNLNSQLTWLQGSQEKSTLRLINWERRWGSLKGSTPAQLVDGEYLTFFHSTFFDDITHSTCYVMGAYTFEKNPPHRITAMSKWPLTFPTIYDTPYGISGNKNLKCVFPAGFVVDGDQIHISCGENDSAVKIVTLSKQILKGNMQQFPF